MGTTREELSSLFDHGVKQGATHMIVVCDTFSYEDYPVYVMPGEDIRKRAAKENTGSMQTVTEVYNLRADKAKQMKARRCFNYGDEEAASEGKSVDCDYDKNGVDKKSERQAHQPKYGVGERVAKAGGEGRVQGVTYTGDSFRYVVKWDVGPTTPHDEAELHPAILPPHYQ